MRSDLNREAGPLLRRAAAAALAAWIGLAPAKADEPWGYELPVFGADTTITALYRSQAGAIVMAFAYGPRDARLADFYDTGLKKRLAPERAREMARASPSDKQVAAALHLTPIPSQLELTNAAGTQFGMDDLSGTRCLWPYDAALTIMVPGPAAYRRDYLVAWKLPRPENQAYGCSYATPLHDGALRMRFHGEEPLYYGNAGPDVYAVFAHRYLVRFGPKGETRFFDHRTDAAMIDAEGIVPLVAQMDGVHSVREAQALVDRIETIIAAGFRK